MLLIIILALAGVFFIALEVILPGMVLGIAGGIAVVAAIVMSFTTDDLDAYGFGIRALVASSVFLGCLVLIGLWLKNFDRTAIGRRLVLGPGSNAKITSADPALVGATGIAKTDLRPSGRADIPGVPKTCDVIAESGFIEGGSTIEVVRVDGRRVVVRGVAASS